jgi:hypothetical protein
MESVSGLPVTADRVPYRRLNTSTRINNHCLSGDRVMAFMREGRLFSSSFYD